MSRFGSRVLLYQARANIRFVFFNATSLTPVCFELKLFTRMLFRTLITAIALTAPVYAATELKVEQYDGPTECDDDQRVRIYRIIFNLR